MHFTSSFFVQTLILALVALLVAQFRNLQRPKPVVVAPVAPTPSRQKLRKQMGGGTRRERARNARNRRAQIS